jgi:hypothetical protein
LAANQSWIPDNGHDLFSPRPKYARRDDSLCLADTELWVCCQVELNLLLFNPASAVGLTESAMHNLSAEKSTGFCLSACIDQRCSEGMLELDRDGVGERRIILRRSRTPSLLQDCASLPALSGLTAVQS